MQQVLSNRHTLLVQFLLAIGGTIALLWVCYSSGIAPNYGGLVGVAELLAWNAVSAFVALSVVGMVLHGLNLLFYRVQVHRHGKPSETLFQE